jgi:hypothetical protein
MSDDPPIPPDSEHDPESDAGGDHEHHGVVETLREEIEEVVEHVPEPVRWTVGKLARLAILVLVGVLVLGIVSAVLYFMNRTELVARELALFLNRTLREHSDLVLDLRDVRGNPFTGFRAIEPRVRFRDGSTVLAAREMHVNYSAWSLVTGGDGSVEVSLEHPSVRLVGANGDWRLPVWRSGKEPGKQKPSSRTLQVHLSIRDASVVTPRPYGETDGVNADLLAETGPVTRVRLERLNWRAGPWGSRLENMTADLNVDSSGVHARVAELRSPDLELRADGGWRPGEKLRRVHVAVGRVRWRWLASVFDNRSFDVPGDGAFVLDAEGDRDWLGRFRTTLEWDSLAAEGTGRATWSGQQLTLDSLSAHSAAGDLTGALRWSRAGWEIRGDARHADPSHWHALHMDGWPRGELNGWFRYAVETRGRPVALLEARLLASEWQGWHADSARVRVDFPPQAADSFSVIGERLGGHFTLRGRIERGGGWSGPYSIRDLPLEEWPDGRATGLTGQLDWAEGTVESRAGALYVTGDLSGSGTRWAAAKFADWTLEGVRGRLLPTPDLSAQAGAREGFFTGIHIDSVSAPIVLGDRVVRFSPLTAEAGDTTLAMTGQASWDGASWWMTLPSAELTSRQFHFRAEPPVRLSGDATGVVVERLAANDRGAHVEASGHWAAPGGPYDFEFTGQRVDLSRVGLPPEWGLAGLADMRLTVQGRSGAPRWRFEGRARAPAFDRHSADSLSLVLSGAAHRLELEDGRFDLAGGSLRAAGAIERAPQEFPDSLSATALLRWLRDAASWRAHATADRMQVAPLASLMPTVAGWDGSVSGTLSLAGSPARPVFDVDAHADRFGWRDIRTERVDLRAHYADGRLEARDLRAHMQNVESSARLSVPLRLALGVTPAVPDEAVSGRIDIPAGDLQVLPLLVPQVQSARGRFDLAAEVSGTAHAPKLSGKGHIKDGLVRPVNRSEVLEGLNAQLHFDESRIVLDTLWARQGRTGRVWSKGAVLLDGGHLKNYRFNLAMRDFAASEEGLYALLFDGDFLVSDGPRVGGERLPQITGQARIKKGVIEFDFANQSEVQKRAATTEPLYWTYRIQAEATSNLRWRPQDADIEFNASLDLQQTPDSLLIFGEMHALRGTYWFLSNRFKILNADLTFDNQLGVDPLLDIAAETRVHPPAPSDPLETITAQLTGRASKPVVSVSSNSGWEQRQILSQLTLGSDSQGRLGARSAADPLDNYFTRQLNAQLSAGLSEFFKGAITDWELQRDQGGLLSGQGDYVVGVGSQVTDKLALRYRQRIGLFKPTDNTLRNNDTDLFERSVEAEYRLNRFIFVTTDVSRRRTTLGTTAPPGTDYNLNLKARWEY